MKKKNLHLRLLKVIMGKQREISLFIFDAMMFDSMLLCISFVATQPCPCGYKKKKESYLNIVYLYKYILPMSNCVFL